MYSSKINEDYVRRLYKHKHQVKKSMTVLANEAIEQYLSKQQNQQLIMEEQINDDRRNVIHRPANC